MNKIFLIGHVGQEPKRTSTGTGVNYSLAINERTKTNGEWVTKTMWTDIVHWGQSADFAEKWIHKGTKIMIEGRLNITEKTDNEGRKRQFINVVAEHCELLSKVENQSNDGQISNANNGVTWNEKQPANESTNQINAAVNVLDEDLPF